MIDTKKKNEPYLPAYKADFDAQGYCIVDGLFPEVMLQEIESFFEQYRASGGELIPGQTFDSVDKTKAQVRYIHPHQKHLCARQWMLHPPVLDVLKGLMQGKEPLGVQTMYYYKPPGTRGQAMHQDNFFLNAAPATCVAAWTPIDDSTVENGCLWGAPKTQHLDILCPKKDRAEIKAWKDYGDTHIDKFPRGARPVPIEVKRGQTLFFNGSFIHGSGPNRTKDRSRRTFIGHYVDEATEQLAKFYHPLYNRTGEVISSVRETAGGPCGDGWQPVGYH